MLPEIKNIILVDDHIIVRDGLKELIEKLGPYKILREFDHGKAFIDALPLSPVPDLIIMDLAMPEMDGDEVMAILNSKNVELPVLVLTLSQDDQKIIKLFRMGVRGYLNKNCTAATMKEALEAIFRTGFYHNDLLAYALKASDSVIKKSDRDLILEKMTGREKEFLSLVCNEDEFTYDQIASIMGVVRRTVDGYRESLFEKFGIKSKTGLVLFAMRHQLFSVNQEK